MLLGTNVKADRISVKETHELLIRHQNGDDSAKEQIIKGNSGLIVYVANKMRNLITVGMDMEDLVSVAMIGMLKAIETFKVDKGVTFATYAVHLMRNEILIADRHQKRHNHVVSLDAPVHVNSSDRDNLVLSQVICDPKHPPQEELIDRIGFQKLIEEASSDLPRRERVMLHKRYVEDLTQREIAAELGISQSYLSRLEKAVLKKMRRRIAKIDVIDSHAKKPIKRMELVDMSKITPAMIAQYKWLFENTVLNTERIAEIVGGSKPTVHKYRTLFLNGNLNHIESDPSAAKELKNFIEQGKLITEKGAKEMEKAPPKVRTNLLNGVASVMEVPYVPLVGEAADKKEQRLGYLFEAATPPLDTIVMEPAPKEQPAPAPKEQPAPAPKALEPKDVQQTATAYQEVAAKTESATEGGAIGLTLNNASVERITSFVDVLLKQLEQGKHYRVHIEIE